LNTDITTVTGNKLQQ